MTTHEVEFWEKVFIASVQSGACWDRAGRIASQAVIQRKAEVNR